MPHASVTFLPLQPYYIVYIGAAFAPSPQFSSSIWNHPFLADVAIIWAGDLHHMKISEASGLYHTDHTIIGILELLEVHWRVVNCSLLERVSLS